MQQRFLFTSLIALSLGAGLVIACSDDDEDGSPITPTPGPDSGNPETGTTPTTDGGPTADADAGAIGTPITALTTTKLANAINPFGLVYASDGFLYASGARTNLTTGQQELAVWRFKDGALDTTFGAGGVLAANLFVDGAEGSLDIVEPSPGIFVVNVNVGGKVFLVKMTQNAGNWEFGTPVFVRFSWDENEAWPVGVTPPSNAARPSHTASGLGVDRSNAAAPKIVVFAAGSPEKVTTGTQRVRNDRWVTRVNLDDLGFDTTFNGGKPYTTDADGKDLADNARRGLVLNDGTILSSGYTNFGEGLGNHVVVIRLLPNGTPDPAFGFGTNPAIPGQTKFNPFLAVQGAAEAYNVVLQASGRYVTTGYGTSDFDVDSKSTDLVSFGFKADGLDTTFGRAGSFAWQSEQDLTAGVGANAYSERGRDMLMLPDERLVHVGSYDDSAAVFITDKDGHAATYVGDRGKFEYSFPQQLYKVALSPDGKTIAATAQSVVATVDGGPVSNSILVTLKVGN